MFSLVSCSNFFCRQLYIFETIVNMSWPTMVSMKTLVRTMGKTVTVSLKIIEMAGHDIGNGIRCRDKILTHYFGGKSVRNRNQSINYKTVMSTNRKRHCIISTFRVSCYKYRKSPVPTETALVLANKRHYS